MFPAAWTDKSTGHRIRRLSTEPGTSTLYFNYSSFTPSGDYLIVSTPTCISKTSLSTFETTPIISISTPFKLLFTGRKTRTAYYSLQAHATQGYTAKTICAVDIDTGVSRVVCEVEKGNIQALNADETLLAGVDIDLPPDHPRIANLQISQPRDPRFDQVDFRAKWPDGTDMCYADAKEVGLDERLEAGIHMKLFVVDTATGIRRDVYSSTDWLNHLLFSPTDPHALMFCHEGPWHKVDRMWVLRLDQHPPAPVKVHEREMNMEIAGHEWWSHDGRTIYYDLQTPRGLVFWLASYNIITGERRRYHLKPEEWSVHFNSSPTADLFCGDGSDDTMVSHTKGATWLYLFTPRAVPDVAGIKAKNADQLVKAGYLESRRLVDLAGQDYRYEPNAMFSPNGKWVIYRSNMGGERHVYAVEVEKR
ncbi:Oligogalacturonate lyase-domain-containing protein [Dioszegia hungarica]|uniref:Oligogalacturonate lyase-domain-containing protein n=1 Tax=Dioszegia hungarica TaxID=4972 RepID=A0AA38LSQ4_9TREE|nr:Oligogalacturonate lyase-domain-containing protein [Dioszegia hungarica]KAI9632894.1 Oligogalacturonate lyase-domain-containing protein [Dioszegia hungarica]